MLDLSEGKQIDAEKVRTGIKRAFLKGIFEQISVQTNDHEPADVMVIVQEKDRITKVSVRGDHVFSARKIRNLLIMKQGDIMRYDRMTGAERDLKEKYALSGYPEAVVSISTAATKEPHRVELVVTIESGPPLLISRIRIDGTDVVTPGDLRLSEGDVYDQFRVREELKRIQERLRKENYYHPVTGPFSFQEGTLAVKVDPGNQLAVIITGNSALSTRRLMKEVPFFDVETVNDEIGG